MDTHEIYIKAVYSGWQFRGIADLCVVKQGGDADVNIYRVNVNVGIIS